MLIRPSSWSWISSRQGESITPFTLTEPQMTITEDPKRSTCTPIIWWGRLNNLCTTSGTWRNLAWAPAFSAPLKASCCIIWYKNCTVEECNALQRWFSCPPGDTQALMHCPNPMDHKRYSPPLVTWVYYPIFRHVLFFAFAFAHFQNVVPYCVPFYWELLCC